MKEHLSDKKSIVYRNKDKNPTISLIIDCPCENKHKLELVEKKYINQYAKKYEAKVFIKCRNEENKEKPKIEYSFKIEKEDELLERIEKMVAFKNIPNKKELQVQYHGGKKVNVSKRYGSITLSKAMDYMKAQ